MTELANFRDLGGLPVADGSLTRAGVLYRSAAPRAGDARPDGAGAWPPVVAIDLRTVEEVQLAPSGWASATRVVHHDLSSAARSNRELADVDLASVYATILERVPARVTAVVGMLDHAGPTLVHCAAGKDRTGIVVAMLLTLAGVRPEAVVADYRETSASMPAVLERMRSTGLIDDEHPLPQAWVDAPGGAVQVVLNALHDHAGGPEGWFLEHGGDAAALLRWRERILVRG